MEDSSQKIALITGASSGIGLAFAEQLAMQGVHLMLVARRQERLEKIARELRQRQGIEVAVIIADLTTEQGISRVEQQIAQTAPLLYLINSAGFGTPGVFAEIPLEKTLNMLRVHVEAITRFSWKALQGMGRRNQGFIINVSSLAAFLPFPSAVMYCATKTYINTFSLALQKQLRYTDIKIQALCPGYTYSGFHDTSEYQKFSRSKIPKWLWMTSEDVVKQSLRALHSKSVIFVPGMKNQVLLWFMRNPVTGYLFRVIDEIYYSKRGLSSSMNIIERIWRR